MVRLTNEALLDLAIITNNKELKKMILADFTSWCESQSSDKFESFVAQRFWTAKSKAYLCTDNEEVKTDA